MRQQFIERLDAVYHRKLQELRLYALGCWDDPAELRAVDQTENEVRRLIAENRAASLALQ